MLDTPSDQIHILINGQNVNYQPMELPNLTENFKVDKRYQIVVDLSSTQEEEYESIIIDSVLMANDGRFYDSGPETGQYLALISFSEKN